MSTSAPRVKKRIPSELVAFIYRFSKRSSRARSIPARYSTAFTLTCTVVIRHPPTAMQIGHSRVIKPNRHLAPTQPVPCASRQHLASVSPATIRLSIFSRTHQAARLHVVPVLYTTYPVRSLFKDRIRQPRPVCDRCPPVTRGPNEHEACGNVAARCSSCSAKPHAS